MENKFTTDSRSIQAVGFRGFRISSLGNSEKQGIAAVEQIESKGRRRSCGPLSDSGLPAICFFHEKGPSCQRATERLPSARQQVQLVSDGLREPRVNQR